MQSNSGSGIFKDKIALVTGGASGIGLALCQELGRRGAVVVVADINAEGARSAAAAITAAGGRASGEALDVSQAEAFERLIQQTAAEHGRLDLLFNNAGIAIAGEAFDLTLEHWRRIVDINLLGVVYGTRAAYPLMIRQKSGHIVNIASFAGIVGHAAMVAYCMTKHGVVGLSTALRIEAEAYGVRVSVVCPGLVQTNIQNAVTLLNADKAEVLSRVPVKMVAADDAACRILAGVAKNREYIVFPFYARLIWWLQRLCPALLRPFHRKTIADFRALRKPDPVGARRDAPG